jgi:hypothetical protein
LPGRHVFLGPADGPFRFDQLQTAQFFLFDFQGSFRFP